MPCRVCRVCYTRIDDDKQHSNNISYKICTTWWNSAQYRHTEYVYSSNPWIDSPSIISEHSKFICPFRRHADYAMVCTMMTSMMITGTWWMDENFVLQTHANIVSSNYTELSHNTYVLLDMENVSMHMHNVNESAVCTIVHQNIHIVCPFRLNKFASKTSAKQFKWCVRCVT